MSDHYLGAEGQNVLKKPEIEMFFFLGIPRGKIGTPPLTLTGFS